MPEDKPIASLSLDLDNKWSYMKTHGDEGWESFPSYLDVVVPRFLDILDELDLKITVFVVGQDAAIESNHAALAQIPARGHEVGNHSFNHEPWLHLYSEQEIVEEFEKAEAAIESATGAKTKGFRGPGFSFSPTVLDVLARRGYAYDCSTFPTFLGPLARMYYFWTSRLEKDERDDRKQLFGKFREGFRPLKPYKWKVPSGSLLEIPVTTMPIFKMPFHVSYLLYLAGYSRALALLYVNIALALCKLTGVRPSVLLHPLDFMGAEDVPELAFFPAMNQGAEKKCNLVRDVLKKLTAAYDVQPVAVHAAAVSEQSSLKLYTPK